MSWYCRHGCRLVPQPAARRTVVIGFADGPAAADAVPAVMKHQPIGLEGFDGVLMDDVRSLGLHRAGWDLLPDGGGWLLAELGAGTAEQAGAAAQCLAADFDHARVLSEDEAPQVWGIRESGLGATARVPGQRPTWPGWEDSAVAPARLGDYLRELRALCDRFGYHAALYGHFGQGCVHTRIDFDLASATGVAAFRSFMTEAARLCVRYGGSLSGEHGDGQARAELLPLMFGSELVAAFTDFRRIWDPDAMMNPRKVVDPDGLDENLRLGPHYRPRQLQTHFAFTEDGGDFAQAVSRCVGVGACRTHSGTVMCPSYQATREEEHSTRGRAHLLFELLNGDELTDGWRDPHVKDALDLCMSCKGCKHDCPVGVDMARYKAEFLSHWYSRRLRPAPAYSMGLLMHAARLASLAPGLTNAVTHAPGLSTLAKRLAGVHPARDAPRFAPATFRRAWARRPGPPEPGGMPVLLWPDTFTDHFHPQTGVAAVRVLQDARLRSLAPIQMGVLRAAALTTGECSATPAGCSPAPCRSSARRSTPVSRWSCWNPAARQCSARNSPNCCPATAVPRAWQHRPTPWPNSSASTGRTGDLPDWTERCWHTGTAMTARCSTSPPSSGCCSAPAHRWTSPRPAAAAWPARSDSRPRTTTSPRPSASRSCCPPSATPPPRPPW